MLPRLRFDKNISLQLFLSFSILFSQQTFSIYSLTYSFTFMCCCCLSWKHLDMCEWYNERVWNCTYCFPISTQILLPFLLIHSLSFYFHIHKIFFFSLFFRARGHHQRERASDLERGEKKIHKRNIKIICLTHISFSFHLSTGLIIKWFFW